MWRQGEHVALIGQTQSGKTFLLTKLLEYRKYVVVFRTKEDKTRFAGYRYATREAEIPPVIAGKPARWVLFPGSRAAQVREFSRFMARAFKEGGWTVVVDELFYLDQQLHLTEPLEHLLTQGAGRDVTMVCGMQRPSRVTRFGVGESIHIFAFALEGRDQKILVEATGTPRIVPVLDRLQRYHFAYYNRGTRQVSEGEAHQLDRILGPVP